MSVPNILKKIKVLYVKNRELLAKSLFIAIVVIIVILAYGIGKLESKLAQKNDIIYSTSELTVYSDSIGGEAISEVIQGSGDYVASRNGSKYYYNWCSGVNRIKKANKIWFKSELEAIELGYEPSKNCPGLLGK